VLESPYHIHYTNQEFIFCPLALEHFKHQVNGVDGCRLTPLSFLTRGWTEYDEDQIEEVVRVINVLLEYGADPYFHRDGGVSAYSIAEGDDDMQRVVNIFDEYFSIKEPGEE
jgi:hypothetical protein